MKVGSLFSGYGGLDLAIQSLWPDAHPAWFVEFDKHPSAILARHWPNVPNYGDITAVDWAAVEPVDILTGGFPCQDLSHAGKRAVLRPGTRSGLWEHMAYAIDQLRNPALVLIENVRGLLSAEAHSNLERDCWCVGDEREPALRALGAVLGDLADLGYRRSVDKRSRCRRRRTPRSIPCLHPCPLPRRTLRRGRAVLVARGGATCRPSLLSTPNARDHKGSPSQAWREQSSLPRDVERLT